MSLPLSLSLHRNLLKKIHHQFRPPKNTQAYSLITFFFSFDAHFPMIWITFEWKHGYCLHLVLHLPFLPLWFSNQLPALSDVLPLVSRSVVFKLSFFFLVLLVSYVFTSVPVRAPSVFVLVTIFTSAPPCVVTFGWCFLLWFISSFVFKLKVFLPFLSLLLCRRVSTKFPLEDNIVRFVSFYYQQVLVPEVTMVPACDIVTPPPRTLPDVGKLSLHRHLIGVWCETLDTPSFFV